ncbi:MAG: hypothetical protein Q8J65_05015 [Nitrosomonadales bacterium]|nr:hypothetical protein [Nitrosomonadales bacterium]
MKVETPLNIPIDHPAFAGHFPGMPIVPGVLLLDEALHAITNTTGPQHTWQVSSVKFLSPLAPGESVSVLHEVQANGSARFDIMAGERHIVTGSMTNIDMSDIDIPSGLS